MVLLQPEDREKDAFWRGWVIGFAFMFFIQIAGLVAILLLR